MNLENLRPAYGAVHHKKKRLGRGQGSGKGGTSARGHNGAKSRSGYSIKIGFEGGQMPLQRRIPKYGFTAINPTFFKCICLSTISDFVEKYNLSAFTLKELQENGIIRAGERIKILSDGQLSKKIVIEAHSFSLDAKKKIEELGGSVLLAF